MAPESRSSARLASARGHGVRAGVRGFVRESAHRRVDRCQGIGVAGRLDRLGGLLGHGLHSAGRRSPRPRPPPARRPLSSSATASTGSAVPRPRPPPARRPPQWRRRSPGTPPPARRAPVCPEDHRVKGGRVVLGHLGHVRAIPGGDGRRRGLDWGRRRPRPRLRRRRSDRGREPLGDQDLVGARLDGRVLRGHDRLLERERVPIWRKCSGRLDAVATTRSPYPNDRPRTPWLKPTSVIMLSPASKLFFAARPRRTAPAGR